MIPTEDIMPIVKNTIAASIRCNWKCVDTLLEISREDYFTEYTKKEDLIVRYLLHRHLYGKKNTQKELYQNI